MKKIGFLTIFLLTIFSMHFVFAEGEPGTQPCKFYGTITINEDNNNLSASSVTAYVADEENTEANISHINLEETPLGEYYLKVYNINSEIKFRINGIDTDQDAQLCISGEPYIELDLTATVENFEGSYDPEDESQTNLENSSITVGDSSDLTQGFFGEQEVVIKENGSTRIKFNYDFDSSKLDLSNIKITKQDNTSTKGSIEISGIDLPEGETKTVYIDKIANEDYVCVLDKEDAKVSGMTTSCTGADEVPVKCDGNAHSGYTCTDLGNGLLEITGLTHSAVGESTYSPPSSPSSGGSSGGGGGGGGGGSSSSSTTTCTESWSCSDWSECLDRVQTRVCLDSNNCGTIYSQPETARTCETEETGSEETETQEQEGTTGPTGAIIGALGKGNAFVLGIIAISAIIGIGIFLNKRRK